jgi:hypothetical protein
MELVLARLFDLSVFVNMLLSEGAFFATEAISSPARDGFATLLLTFCYKNRPRRYHE